MSRVLVSGLINIEVTLRVDGFPIPYAPVHYPFFGIDASVSGVGYNVSKALTVLGNQVRFLSLIGSDIAGQMVRHALARDGIPEDFVLDHVEKTARSVILYDGEGRRQIHVDLKDIQEQRYPVARYQQAIAGCDLAALCNVNFSRPLLCMTRERGIPIATDVHTVADLDDAYNADFMAAADILFMSDEALPCPPEEWINALTRRYAPAIAVVGLGGQGALMAVRQDGFVGRVPAVRTRPVVNTIGAGDALFSAFVHFYARNGNPYQALEKATRFASYKIGAAGAADGFLEEAALEALFRK
ncbi:MAG: carbohydrate kinase family protein [Anaerolineae bacterium]|nr:carbohydrate kinase family protein [Anaerolineae bacterium]